jgi:hypothetical protein
MADQLTTAPDRVGPFVAGATSSDLIALTRQQDLSLRLVEPGEQMQDYYRQRCEGLCAAAKEFFYDYEESTSLVFQKTGDSKQIPDFIEYIYCWLVEDRLGGLILFGVIIDAGTHEEIDQHENSLRAQSAEISEALSTKYTQSAGSMINYFNFDLYAAPPPVASGDSKDVFSSFQRLVTAIEENEKKTRIETRYCGPTLVQSSRRNLGADAPTGAAHTSQFSRRTFANDKFFILYDHDIERYVRTIESLHFSTTLVYLSRRVMDDLGRKLNSKRAAQVQAEARREVTGWEQSLLQAEEARRIRIARLSEMV